MRGQTIKLEAAAKYMNADVSGANPALLETEVRSFAVDSREVKAGTVFFALAQPEYANNGFNGDFKDSTQYVPSAFENGAAACVLRPDRFAAHSSDLERFRDRLVFVEDSIAALQALAAGVYREWNRPVVAITGSAGKTTARELTARVLESAGHRVLRSAKNRNNGLGHPLTVLALAGRQEFDLAVLEMGMSTPMHEIERLCRITPPDVAVELNVLPVHLEHLGSIENIATAKAELVQGMKEGGTAVLNADDPRVLAMSGISRGRTITFGLLGNADVSAGHIEMERFGETRFVLTVPGSSAKVSLQLAGRHNVSNALAAAAVGFSFGMDAQQIADALNTVKPPAQRGEVVNFEEGFTVVNDSYNSNPAALLSMIKTLTNGRNGAQRIIVVAGEMLELGPAEKEIHRETGKQISRSGVDLLIGVRGLAGDLVEGAKGNDLERTMFFENSREAGKFLAGEVKAGDLILVKGSRGVRTEEVVEKLLENFKKCE